MVSGYFQEPWVTDYDLDQYQGAVYADGVQALIDCVMASDQPVTIIAIGVVTNLAEALRREPKIAERCRFVGMHGSIRVGYGGSSEPSPEANVKNDVESLRVVFSAPWLEKIITPLDTCGLVVLQGDLYQKIFEHESPVLKAVIENYQIWAGLVNWMAVDYFKTKSSTLFDTVAVYLAYCQALVVMEEVSLTVTDEGLTVEDQAGDLVQAAMQWLDLDQFYQHLTARLLAAAGETK
jgi:inosine-uridine nucleoside N-ribohydrolase